MYQKKKASLKFSLVIVVSLQYFVNTITLFSLFQPSEYLEMKKIQTCTWGKFRMYLNKNYT